MDRRKFLKLTGFGAALAVLPSIGIASGSSDEAIYEVIMREFSYLKLDPDGVKQFLADYAKIYQPNTIERMKIRCYNVLKVNVNDSYLLDRYVKKYIESTDFFLNKMDESKTVKYLNLDLFDPHKTPCANPFSYSHYPNLPA